MADGGRRRVCDRILHSKWTVPVFLLFILVFVILIAAHSGLPSTITRETVARNPGMRGQDDDSNRDSADVAPEEGEMARTDPLAPSTTPARHLHEKLMDDILASKAAVRLPAEDFEPVPVEYSTVLVLLAHDRYDYIKRTLEGLLKTRNVEKYTIMISVDRERLIDNVKEAVASVANRKKVAISFLSSELPFADNIYKGEPSITRHMASVFHQVFKLGLFEYVIFLEDDLDVSDDFFDYFASTGPLLHPLHPTARNLFCVSAWNDNGFNHVDLNPSRVYRTDWYPGLGAMFHRSMWVGRMEFEWPVWDSVEWGYDNWLRFRSTISKYSDCLAPEMPRTHHFSTRGMHVGASAAPLYARMSLSDGETGISAHHLEVAMTGISMRDYYKMLINSSTEVKLSEIYSRSWGDTHQGQSVFAFIDDHGNVRDPPEARKILTKFNLYPDNFRMRFRGLLTFKVKTTDTRITLIRESMRDYWSQDIEA